MANHEETATRLSDLIEGELGRIGRSRVERHLRRCEGCRALLRSLAGTIERLRGLSRHADLPVDPGLAERVVARLGSEGTT